MGAQKPEFTESSIVDGLGEDAADPTQYPPSCAVPKIVTLTTKRADFRPEPAESELISVGVLTARSGLGYWSMGI